MGEPFEPKYMQRDGRGTLIALPEQREWQETNYIEKRADATRRDRYHIYMRKIVYIIIDKEVEAGLLEIDSGRRMTVVLRSADMLRLEPRVSHIVRTTDDSLWLNFLNRRYDHAQLDLCCSGEPTRT
jgi:hypothetical protein